MNWFKLYQNKFLYSYMTLGCLSLGLAFEKQNFSPFKNIVSYYVVYMS